MTTILTETETETEIVTMTMILTVVAVVIGVVKGEEETMDLGTMTGPLTSTTRIGRIGILLLQLPEEKAILHKKVGTLRMKLVKVDLRIGKKPVKVDLKIGTVRVGIHQMTIKAEKSPQVDQTWKIN